MGSIVGLGKSELDESSIPWIPLESNLRQVGSLKEFTLYLNKFLDQTSAAYVR